ncbi:MAG: hypothetical protein H6621_03805 [Halobacteriovoraceae bacterium]|nr:hypothetical protein [Halobacteriovoraceae bacterium]MCB9094173.1 hypothetical protein [Halobacteriovoraceae bacterium]
MKFKFAFLISLFSFINLAHANYECYYSWSKAEFVDKYTVSNYNKTIERDNWDYYYGWTSANEYDHMKSSPNSYEFIMKQKALKIFHFEETDLGNSVLFEAKNGIDEALTLEVTSDYAERLPYGLRSFVSSRFGNQKALLANLEYNENSEVQTLYCFEL